jgi:hypothetical protein
VGCQPQAEITQHSIPKDRSGLEHLRKTPPAATAAKAASTEDDRMLVAIADREDATWFFKLTGPVSRVATAESQWRPFLEAVTFDESGKPKWELPEGWSAGPQRPMRFATLRFGAERSSLELVVSQLSAGQDLLANVNRWRGQLGLSPTTQDKLPDELTELESGDQKLTVFDATGKMSGGMMPPFAGGRSRPSAGPSRPATAAVQFDAPQGWTKDPPSMFLKARLRKTDGDRSAQISVSSLPASANKWLPNVKRWAGQLGMNSLDDAALDKLTTKVTVDGVEGQQVALIPAGLDDGESPAATVAVMVKKNDNAWFFKLTGDRQLVSDNREVFAAFLSSVKLP